MSEGTRVNGPGSPTGKFIDSIDPDDPEYIRNLQRPAEVKEDMKQMEGRSRVSVVLNSQAFKEELEAVIQEQIRQGGSASLFALQQISDLLLPQSRGFHSSFARSSPVIPINDIRGVETLGYSKQEKVLRCKLASCYRLVDMFGWTHGIYNHISARVSQDQELFLLNPFGMLYSEITASTLVKVDIRGEVVDTGSTGLGISKAGFCLHSAIHQARPDIRCIIHLHTPPAVAVSATKQGFLPISQEALICGKVSYHDYNGILVDQGERDLLARNLGPFNKVMFLRNHGVAACGETIEEAFHYAFNVIAACEAQVKVMSVGMENLVLVDEDTREKTFMVGSQGGGGVDTSGRKWRCGELEFEALMRTLDNSGYRTGHVYKQPLMKQEKKERINSDVEVPPASSSFTYIFDGDYEHSKYISPMKLAMERQKQAYKAGWLTSPNTYKKQEIEEIGTTTPKKITKWVQDGETPEQRSTAVRIDHPNQFAPQGSNPKEFKEKQKSIRKDYYEEKVSAGPQSKILDGISEWEEATRTQDGEKTVVVGAASKGIIQRDHQHNAVVYRSYYAANPFENMTEEEIEAYKQGLKRQEQGEEPEDVPGPEGRLISSEERQQNIQQSQEEVHEDTEAQKTAPQMTADFGVSERHEVRPEVRQEVRPEVRQEVRPEVRQEVRQEDRTQAVPEPRSPVSPKEPLALSMPSAPLPLEELGLGGLVDTLLQAVVNAALSPSLNPHAQPSPTQAEEPAEHSASVSPPSSQLSPVSSSAPVQGSVSTEASGELGRPSGELGRPSGELGRPSGELGQPSGELGRPSGELVKATAQTVEVPVSKDELSEAAQVMTVQLQPTKLFQGKAGNGVMKISFSIQSKVTRRKGKGPKSSWPVENVTIMQTQPKVMMVESEESQPPKVLQDQQNVAQVPCLKGAPSMSVPLSPTCREKQYKRNVNSSGKRQGSTKLSRPKKKFSRWSRRGLTHPLSPVKEEFWDGDDTLEALLAQQNVQLDSDESLEDLLLMTDDYKENFVPKPQSDKSQGASSSFSLVDKAAPIATVEDLDEIGCLSPSSAQGEKPREEPALVVSQAAVSYSSPSVHGPGNSSPVKPYPSQPEQQAVTGDESSKTAGKVLKPYTKAKDIDDIKFADEEMSSTFPEASDGDIAPRKQEESVETPEQIRPACESVDHLSEEVSKETSNVKPVSVTNNAEDFIEKEDTRQEKEEQNDSVSPGADQTDKAGDGRGKTEVETVTAEVTETSPPGTGTDAEAASEPKPSSDPVIIAPLASQEEDISDISGLAVCSGEEEKAKTSLFRTDSASLEHSPIVSSPPYDDFPPDPIYRELHRVRSLEDELDDSSSVQRRLNKGHAAVRRVQSAYDSLPNKNRNVAVIDAVLHTVTIDPAKITQSGQPVSTYLTGPSDESSPSDQKKKWTLMDSVSKSLEALDVKDLAKEGSMIYGRSLEILIQDGSVSQKSSQTSLPSQGKSQSLENVLEDFSEKEKITQKGTKLYKDDVVVITKSPMDFSAISPQVRKDIAEEEGPLVTSSPKLGRRKEGSFKKYQSKMGKSEETLLEVAPLSPERTHPAATRSKSFPQNYGLIKNRSREALLDDSPPMQRSDKEREFRSSSQSVDELSERNKRRTRPRRTRNSDPVFSYNTLDTLSHSETKRTDSLGRRKSEEVFTRDPLSPARSANSVDRDETNREEKEESRRRRRRQQTPEGGRESLWRRRRRNQAEENIEAVDTGGEDDLVRSLSAGRDRRRRRRDQAKDMETADAGGEDDRSPSTGRDRRRKRDQAKDMKTADVEDDYVRSPSAGRDSRRRSDQPEDIETAVTGADEHVRSPSAGKDRRRRRDQVEENMETADAGAEDEHVRSPSTGRDRRRRRDRAEERETADIEDDHVRSPSTGRDRRRRRDQAEDIETAPARAEDDRVRSSTGRDRRRRDQPEQNRETADAGGEDDHVRSPRAGKDRRRKRRDQPEENMETADVEKDHVRSSAGRDRRRRRDQAEDMEITGAEDDYVRSPSSRRDRRRRDQPEENRETADIEDDHVRSPSTGRDRRRERRSQAEDIETADASGEDDHVRSNAGRDRRRRSQPEESMETADIEDDHVRSPSAGKDRRRRRDQPEENLETEDARAEDENVRSSTGRDRRRRDQAEDTVETTGAEDDHLRSPTSGRDRRRRRDQAEESVETADVEDDHVRSPSTGKDRRRRRQRELKETENTPPSEGGVRGQEQVNRETHFNEDTEQPVVIKTEARVVEATPFTPASESEEKDTEDFPPPPDDLYDYEKQTEVVAETKDHSMDQQEEDEPLPAYPPKVENIQDEDEENQPPRVRRPKQPKSKQTEVASPDSSEPRTDGDDVDDNVVMRRRHDQKPETNPSSEDTPFMSTFKQPVRKSQTLGEDFPSLSTKPSSGHSAVPDNEDADTDSGKATKDNKRGSISSPLEPDDIVPIAGNLDILDYNDDANQEHDPSQHTPAEEEKSKTSRARQRAERRRRGRLDSDRDMGRTNASGTEGRRGSRDSLVSGDTKVSSSRSSLTRQDSLDSKEPRERLGRRSSRESDKSKNLKEKRDSRESLTSKDGKNSRGSRDSLARRESHDSATAGLDIMNLDQEPPRGRRDRQERESAGMRNMNKGEKEENNNEKLRSEGRLRGRRSGRGEGYPQNDRPRRSSRIDEEETQNVPLIKVQTASRETLDRDDFVPPLPPKQYRSRDRLSELDYEPRRSRSREMLDAPDSQDVPPELPPKKNKKSLSCVSGQDMESGDRSKKDRRSKERSSSKDRKKMPPPPAPPAPEKQYDEEPRRRRHHDSNQLSVPGDSFYRESSFDASFDRDRKGPRSQKPRETGGSSYYGDSEDELDSIGARYARKDRKKVAQEEVTVSPPQTPRPARKISTSSYGSVSARIARSVSFDDGYTPTMSHPPRPSKSRESLGSEASYHSTGYRPRSYSGASETSVTSNPLNHEPWRAKSAAQRQQAVPSSSRSRRSRSQAEPTYSANAGRRRRSRTPAASDSNRLYQPRRTRSRTSLPDSPTRSTAPFGHSKSRETSLIADDSFSDAYSHGYGSEAMPPVPAPRSQPDRRSQRHRQREGDGEKPGYIMDSASGGETLEERSSKEGSPTKEAPSSPTKEKKKKKKFHMPSFAKKKKDSKESTL